MKVYAGREVCGGFYIFPYIVYIFCIFSKDRVVLVCNKVIYIRLNYFI